MRFWARSSYNTHGCMGLNRSYFCVSFEIDKTSSRWCECSAKSAHDYPKPVHEFNHLFVNYIHTRDLIRCHSSSTKLQTWTENIFLWFPWKQCSWGQHGAHLGPTGPWGVGGGGWGVGVGGWGGGGGGWGGGGMLAPWTLLCCLGR